MKAGMKVTVINSQHYFGRTWQLKVSTPKKEKVFYLGQDVKVCSRLLGMSPREVISEIGTDNIENGTEGADKLGRLIAERLGLTGRNMDKVEPWGLAVE